MRHFILGALAVVAVASCMEATAGQPYVEVGAGYSFNTPWCPNCIGDGVAKWSGSNPRAILAAGYEFSSGVHVEYQHVSNWLSGWPLNDDTESAIDMVVIKYRFKFGR